MVFPVDDRGIKPIVGRTRHVPLSFPKRLVCYWTKFVPKVRHVSIALFDTAITTVARNA
jgi:hypothetical protein